MQMNVRAVPMIVWSYILCLLFIASFGCSLSAGQERTIFSTFNSSYLVPSPQDYATCALSNDSTTYNCLYSKPVLIVDTSCGDYVQSFSTMFDLVLNISKRAPRRRAFVVSPNNNSFHGHMIGPYINVPLPDPSFSVEFDVGDLSLPTPTASVEVSCYLQPVVSANLSLDLSQVRSGDLLDLVVWIENDGSARVLNITVVNAMKGYFYNSKPKIPIISMEVDLRSCFDVDRPAFLGLSVDVIEQLGETFKNIPSVPIWTFNSNGPAPDIQRNTYIKNYKKLHIPTWTKLMLGIAVPGGLVFVGLTYVIYVLYRRNSRLHALTKKYNVGGIDEFNRGPQSFTFKILSAATKGFSSNHLIGKGGFGSVYKGKLHLRGARDETNVAVKRISATSGQGVREFLNEVKIVGQVRHRNLVTLLGWCHEKDNLLLVYEFMPNGSLDQHLFSLKRDTNDSQVLTWARRLKILSGVGTALAYLHEEWVQRIIHRDIKSSNVLLDSDFNGRLGDFGLAKLSDHNQGPVSTQILAGTYGYLAPELGLTLKATEKTDVYSFGALVLEVATGRSPVLAMDERRQAEDHVLLVDWVWSLYGSGKILDVADISLKNAYDCTEMVTLLKIGLFCCHPDPGQRPTMREVLNIWRGAIPCPDLPKTKPVPVFLARLQSKSIADVDKTDVDLGDVENSFKGDDVDAFKTSASSGWLRSRSGWKSTPLPI